SAGASSNMGQSAIRSYESPLHLGVPATNNIFEGTCYVQEKVDGSQISFCVIPDPIHPGMPGKLHIRSKGGALDLAAPGKLFAPAVATIVGLYERGYLFTKYIYRGESIAAPRHNVLAYKRIPHGGVILYDIEEMDSGTYLT